MDLENNPHLKDRPPAGKKRPGASAATDTPGNGNVVRVYQVHTYRTTVPPLLQARIKGGISIKIIFFSSKTYPEPDAHDYGDCILVDQGAELLIYDCGSEEHAKRVEAYMHRRGFRQAVMVLSHNDKDHYAGIPYLADRGLLSKVCTPLFLKHLDDLLDRIGDKRYKREPLKEKLLEIFSNVTAFAEEYPGLLVDALEQPTLISGAEIVGPALDYALDAVADRVNSCKSNMIDAETVTNAVSVHVSCISNGRHVLLCGDSTFEAIEDLLPSHTVIQLPHHGKPETAEKIFNAKFQRNDTVYLVSDNKGSSFNGGSKDLDTTGHHVLNTQQGDVSYPLPVKYTSGGYTGRTLGLPGWR